MDGKGGIVLIYDNEIKDNQIINYLAFILGCVSHISEHSSRISISGEKILPKSDNASLSMALCLVVYLLLLQGQVDSLPQIQNVESVISPAAKGPETSTVGNTVKKGKLTYYTVIYSNV